MIFSYIMIGVAIFIAGVIVGKECFTLDYDDVCKIIDDVNRESKERKAEIAKYHQHYEIK